MKISRVEKGIRAFYQEKVGQVEMTAWSMMKESNKYFFKYIKRTLHFKSPMGPFMDKDIKMVNESHFLCPKCLCKNYTAVLVMCILSRSLFNYLQIFALLTLKVNLGPVR